MRTGFELGYLEVIGLSSFLNIAGGHFNTLEVHILGGASELKIVSKIDSFSNLPITIVW